MSLESDAYDRFIGQDDLEPEVEPGLWPCERCGTYGLLTSVTVVVGRQTRTSPAEYAVLWLCDPCRSRERDPDEPPDADCELGDMARERDEKAWDEKKRIG